jgi:predicted dehydrogenase
MSQFLSDMNTCIPLVGLMVLTTITANAKPEPVKVGVIGLTHTHVHWILGRPADDAVVIVGIVERDVDLARRYTQQHGLSMDLVYSSMDDLIRHAKPEAVLAFGTIYDHLEIVETFAPLGIHVMVEKPLAVSLDHAKKMEALATRHGIHLLTNYETTWYPTVHAARDGLRENRIGRLTQMVMRYGHKGPVNIGVNEEFLEWLIDPVKNGGGAIMDFGCYGANVATWMMDGEKPLSVLAVTQQLQKENNPLVDDESTIILTYRHAKVTIQASWNWPIGRKDMDVYGTDGVIHADNRNDLRVRMSEGYDGFTESRLRLDERPAPYQDPFAFFAAVIRNEITLSSYDLSSLENNMMVMEILDAARASAMSGRAVLLD